MSLRAAVTKSLTDWPLLTVIGISLVSFALRIAPLGESLWLDELHTAWCAIAPLDEVAPRAALGNQSPIFFWLEWLLIGLLGENEFALRLPSLIAGSLLPLALFLLARRWKADAAGLVAAALLAVDHHSLFYGTEARPYALLQLLAVIHIALTAEILVKPTLFLRLAWIFTAAALFHLHYTTALLLAAEVLFLTGALCIHRPLSPYSWTNLCCDQALVALLCLPAIWNIQHIFAHRANWAAFIKPQPLWEAIHWTPLPWWCWLALLILPAISWQLNKRLDIDGRFLVLTTLWLVVPLFAAWLATTTDVARLFFPRYVAAALPASALLAGIGIQLINYRWLKLATGVTTVAIAVWSSGIIPQLQYDGRVIAARTEDWRGCVSWLNEQIATDGLPVFVYSGYIEADELVEPHDPILDEYCLSPVNSLYPLDLAPSDMFPLPRTKPGRLPQPGEMLALHRGGCWLVVRGSKDLSQTVATQLKQALQGSAANSNWQIKETRSFGTVQAIEIRGQ
jgi:mannosyltransferase